MTRGPLLILSGAAPSATVAAGVLICVVNLGPLIHPLTKWQFNTVWVLGADTSKQIKPRKYLTPQQNSLVIGTF